MGIPVYLRNPIKDFLDRYGKLVPQCPVCSGPLETITLVAKKLEYEPETKDDQPETVTVTLKVASCNSCGWHTEPAEPFNEKNYDSR